MHVPVLLTEVLDALNPQPGRVYLDGTLGAGGYAEAILVHSSPDGKVIGLDLDPGAVERNVQRLAQYGARFMAVHGGFHNAKSIIAAMGILQVDGAVLDLGLSSDQLDEPGRGFSFRSGGPLDMRFDPTSGLSALDYLHKSSLSNLEEILARYGEERYCRKLARGIIAARDRGILNNAEDLANVVLRILGPRRGKIHPATRTFQALRIAVNDELKNLERGLADIPDLLSPGGRFCVVSYHSLEDRAVKLSFREKKRDTGHWILVTPKPVRPSDEEKVRNPRARSARMRVLEAVEPSAELLGHDHES